MKAKKLNFDKLLENRTFLRIFSVVVAVLCWLVVAFTISPIIEDTKRDVPVNIDSQANTLAALGLNIIDISNETVNVNVRGSRSVVGGLKPEDLEVTLRVSNVTDPRTYDLEVIPLNTPENYEVIGYSPNRIQVKLDRLVSQSFEVEPMTDGLAMAEGYTFDREYVSPERVTVTGPQVEIDRIARCVVRADLGSPLTGTYVDELPVILEDIQGNEIDLENKHLMLDQEEAQLVVRVLKNKELSLDITFINEPREFNVEELDYSISATGVTVAGPADVIDNHREIMVGVIDIKELRPSNNTFHFDVEMPSSDFVNLDNINSVVVEFNTSGWDEAVFQVENILLLNPPSGFDVSRINEQPLTNVIFAGDEEVLELMSSGDIIAEVDLSEKEYQPGQYTAPVRLSAPTLNKVWPVGSYSVIIQVEEKS